MAALILDLPFQEQIDQSSGPTSEGFMVNKVKYSGKVYQTAFDGPDVESSKEEVWKINWAFIEYASPEEVTNGAVNQLGEIRTFYQQMQLGRTRWKPFELEGTRIWEVIPNSLKVKQTAGNIFEVSMNLNYLYDE